MKLIPAFFQAIYVSYNSLPVSDQIQLLGIIASLVVSIVAIVISLATLHQNSKMLESASRPIVSMYIDCGNGKTGTGSERSESDRSTERLDGFYRTVMFRGRRDGLCSQKKREVIERMHGSDLKECI